MDHTKKTILLIEDSAMTADALSTKLRGLGYETEGLSSCYSANLALHQRKFDLIVSDVMLPDGSSYTVLESIAKTKNKDTPIIVLTSITGEKLDAIKSLNIQDCLNKTLSIREIIDTISNVI